jgi:hypothetical protein
MRVAVLFLSFVGCVWCNKFGGRTNTFASSNFVPLQTPHADFHTGGAYGAGDRIPLPTNWQKPTHTFTEGIINHGNGMYSQTHGTGRTVQWINMPGQVGGAVCASVGGCGPLVGQ